MTNGKRMHLQTTLNSIESWHNFVIQSLMPFKSFMPCCFWQDASASYDIFLDISCDIIFDFAFYFLQNVQCFVAFFLQSWCGMTDDWIIPSNIGLFFSSNIIEFQFLELKCVSEVYSFQETNDFIVELILFCKVTFVLNWHELLHLLSR